MTSSRKSSYLTDLDVGNVVAIRTPYKEGDVLHWTLGSVESFLLNTDVEVRLWRKQREVLDENDIPNTAEAQELMERLKDARRETQKHIKTTDTLIKQLRGCRTELMSRFEVVDKLVLKSKVAVRATRKDVEKIRDFSWNELKSYRNPPKAVLLVVRAVMLLLSEDEAQTWPQMRRVLQDSSFRHRILNYDPERQLSPNRSNYILQECIGRKDFSYEGVLQGSVALSPIYYWILAQLDFREAISQKISIEKANQDRQEEYLALLNELSQEEARIAEFQAIEEELDRQLRFCCAQATASNPDDASTRRHSSDEIANDSYENSFAGRARRAYLRPAFYRWEPTDRVTFIMWGNLLIDFGTTPLNGESDRGCLLQESQIRALENALTKGLPSSTMLDNNPLLEPKPKSTLPPPSRSDVTDRFNCRVKGNRWKNVLARRRSEIEQAFREDTASCLGIPAECITVVDLRLGSLVADLDITHDESRKRSEIQQRLSAFNFPTVMKIYEDEDETTNVTPGTSSAGRTEDDLPRHQVKLAGKLWGELLHKYPTPLMSSLIRDISEAVAVEQVKVKIVDIHANEKEFLTVRYTVSDHIIDVAEVDRVCEAYAFPHTWALYRRHTGLRGGVPVVLPPHETPLRLNESKRTNPTLYSQDASIQMEKQSKKDLTNSLEEPEESLTLNNDKIIAEDAVHRQFSDDRPLYPLMSHNDSEVIYMKTFEGNYWSAALNTARQPLIEAFCTDTAEALGILAREIKIHEFTHTPARLETRFSVPSSVTSPRTVWSKVDAFEYPEVWSLYNQIVYNQKTPVGHFKQVFNGEDWTFMLLNKKKELQEAFVRDICVAMGSSPEDVSVKNITTDRYCAVIHYKVRSEGDFAHDVDYVLHDYPFPNVWTLYNNRKKSISQVADVHKITAAPKEYGNLTQLFEGYAWGEILRDHRPSVEAAFKMDQADCLSAQPENILIRSVEVTPDGLTIVYGLQGVPHTQLEVEKKSGTYHYPEIWALYEASWGVTHHRVVFEGEHWGSALEGREPQFEAVFAACTAELFHLKTHYVRNVEFSIGSLIVEFDLNHLRSLTREEIDRRLMECRYDPIWEMYRERVSGLREQPVATTHTLSFEGEHWGEVLEDQGLRLHEAVHLDASEALGLPMENIKDVQMNATNSILNAQLTAHHTSSQTEDDIKHALSLWGYERVWRLYMMAFPNPTEQLPPALPPGPFSTEHLQTLSSPKPPMDESQSAVFLNGMGVGQAAYVRGGTQYVRSASNLQGNGIRRDLVRDSLIESEKQYRNGPSVKLQPYLEDNTNREGLATAIDRSFGPRNGVAVGVTQNGFSSAVCDGHNPDGLVRCFEGENWNIWLDESPSNGQNTLFVDFTVTFQGKGWDYVIRNRYSLLKGAFCEEVSRALGSVAKNAICETDFTIDKGQQMIARFRLPKAAVAGISEPDVRIRLDTYPYRKVWSLYDEPTMTEASVSEGNALMPTYIVSPYSVGFEASNWELIDWLRHDEIVDAFKQDTARAVCLHVADVDVDELSLHPNLLHLRFRLRHSAGVSSAELKERMIQHDYAGVWKLYEEVPEGGVESRVLVKVFEGDQWGPIVSSSRVSLAGAFCTGISRCLKIPRACVTVVSLTVGSLVVEYTVRSTLSDAVIQERTAAYSHPEVWSFYEHSRVGNPVSLDLGLTASPKALQRTFKGNNWGLLLCRRCNTLQDLFVQQASHILEVPSSQIHVTSLHFAAGNLVVSYCASLTNTSQSAAEKLVGRAEFSELWRLYNLHDYEKFEKTRHEVQLKGKNWIVLLESNFQLLMNIFALCTIRRLDLERQSIYNLGVELKCRNNSLAFSFTLWHPATLTAWRINRTLKSSIYNEAQELQQCNLDDRVKSALSVLFTGPFWRNTPGAKWPVLRQAFAQDVANALGMPRTDVTETHMVREQGGIHFSVHVVHSPVLSEKFLQDVLDRNDFPNVYSIQAMCPPSSHTNYTASIHRVDFEADQWPEVMKCRREQISNALRIDVAAALSVTLNDVDILSMDTIESRLNCAASVIHPETQTADEIQGRMNEYSYNHVWALYEDAVQPYVDVLKTRYVNSTPVPQVRYMGDEMPSQDFVHRVHNAFIEDTACALKCNPSEIVVDGIQLGKLIVHYHVAGCEKPREAAVLAANCQYPNLGALLRSSGTPVLNAPQIDTSN
ncbi:unnamed protein product [Phytomonas sp. EM1]|nr:unnamed protein product [Phytomonas sp. EM1]|eukprot:CCW65101.1 unnamed protein product [Phytomonas sp. isolate EM1]